MLTESNVTCKVIQLNEPTKCDSCNDIIKKKNFVFSIESEISDDKLKVKNSIIICPDCLQSFLNIITGEEIYDESVKITAHQINVEDGKCDESDFLGPDETDFEIPDEEEDYPYGI